MALIRCPECGAEVSDLAVACPRCAYPIRQESSASRQGAGSSPSQGSTQKVKVTSGLLGQPGTAWHGCNLGCLVLIILILGIIILETKL